MSIQETLRDARTSSGLTQQDVAEKMRTRSVRQQEISQWELGLKQPTLPSLIAWAHALGLEVVLQEPKAYRVTWTVDGKECESIGSKEEMEKLRYFMLNVSPLKRENISKVMRK